MILLWLGCAAGWTEDSVLDGLRRRADAGGDGVVDARELPGADSDGDGVVDDAELVAWLDRTGAEWRPPRWSPPPSRAAGVAPHGEAWHVLETLRQEVLAVDPTAPVPGAEALSAVERSDALDDPMSRALLVRIAVEAARVGVVIPAPLVELARAGGVAPAP